MQNQHFCQCTHLVRSGCINKNIDFAWDTLAILVVLYNACHLVQSGCINKNIDFAWDILAIFVVLYNACHLVQSGRIIRSHRFCKIVPCKINIFINTPASYEMGVLTKILILHETPLQILQFFIILAISNEAEAL